MIFHSFSYKDTNKEIMDYNVNFIYVFKKIAKWQYMWSLVHYKLIQPFQLTKEKKSYIYTTLLHSHFPSIYWKEPEFEFKFEFESLYAVEWPPWAWSMPLEQQFCCLLWWYFLGISWCGLLCQLILTTIFGCLISWLLLIQPSLEYKVFIWLLFITFNMFFSWCLINLYLE